MVLREKIWRRLFVASAVLVVAALPFSVALCSWAIIFLTLVWLMEGKMKAKWQILKGNKLIWIFTGFFLLHVIGLLFTQDLANGLFDLEKKLSLFIFPIVFGTTRQLSGKEIKIIFNAFIIACITAVLASIIFVISKDKPPTPVLLNFDHINAEKFLGLFSGSADVWNLLSYAGFGSFIHIHPTYFSLYLTFALVLIVYNYRRAFEHAAILKKLLIILSVALLVIALVFLSSRIVIASFAILCLFSLGYFFFHKRKYFHGISYCFAFITLIFSLVYINPVTRFRLIEEPLNTGFSYPQTANGWNSWNLRMVEWHSALKVIMNNWLAGVGTGDAQKHLDAEYTAIGMGFFGMGFNAHNQFLETALALGFIGFSVLLLSFLYPSITAWQRNNVLYLLFIFLFGMCCLTESMLEVQKGVVFYGFFNALLAFQVFHLNR